MRTDDQVLINSPEVIEWEEPARLGFGFPAVEDLDFAQAVVG